MDVTISQIKSTIEDKSQKKKNRTQKGNAGNYVKHDNLRYKWT